MASKNTVRAAVYCRISKDRTGKRAGVERQERECRQLADRLGWPVSAVYVDDDISAYSGKRRPDYEKLLAALESGAVNAVVAWHPDRLHRRPIELERYIDVCDKHRIANHTVQAGEWDLSTPSGRAVARTLGAWARYESEHKSERIRAAHREIAERGGWSGGSRSFGYERDGITVRKREADEVKRLAAAVIDGATLRSLARDLNARSVPTVQGKQWTSSHLGRMLIRPRLAGLRGHDGALLQAAWPAILDRDTYNTVLSILKDPARSTGASGRRGRVPTALGTGIYICGVCKEPRLRRGSSHTRRPVYQCGGAAINASDGHISRVAEPLDAYVEGALLELLSRPGMIEAMCSVVETGDAKIGELRNEQRDIRGALKALAASCDAGDIDAEQLAIASRRKRERDKQITAELAAVRRRSSLDVLLDADSVERMWDHVLTLEQKRSILAEVLVVTVKPTTPGGRAPDGSYFRTDAVDVKLTKQARAAAPQKPRRRTTAT